MKVDKELIEKYHQNECTPEECAAVEAWLLDDESDDDIDFSLPANSANQLKQEMWANIVTDLPADTKIAKRPIVPIWLKAAAACLVFAACAWLAKDAFTHKAVTLTPLIEVDNSTAMQVRHLKNDEYQLSVGPGTSASIDNREGIIHFNGSMIIRPQRDIEFSFGSYPQKQTFKSGETYILLDEQRGDGRVTIVNEKNLVDMPPGLQKRIITEFNI